MPEPTAKSFDAMWDAADRVLMPDEELTVTVRKAALVADALIRDADQYRREGLADAAVLLVAGKVVPTMTLEDWARPLGLTQAEVRDAVARWKAEQYARAGVKAPAPTRAGHLQVLDGRSRDGDTKRRLREVATIYRADRAEGGTGTRAVADRLGVGAGQAAQLVTRARRLGYITEQPADAGDYPCPEDGCSHIAHTKRGAATNARTHIPMTCPKCGRATNAAGYGRHVSVCAGAGGDAA